jgi:hypothetical protein
MVFAQSFAPQVGFNGSKAIHKDSAVFVDWAKEITVNRGFKNIGIPSLGVVDFGTNENALNQADGNPNIVSLGDNGIAIIQFNYPIVNGVGADFAVFENGFLKEESSELAFLELAFVEVSTDGIEYVRFPSVSETPTTTQMDSFGFIDARYIHNLAGKYINNYGTPFDLSDLTTLIANTSVDLNNINFIKIIDVIGTINSEFASYDSQNNIINDPFPTEFSSGGFDLDAIGVINNTQNKIVNSGIFIYPNPSVNKITILTENQVIKELHLFSIDGKLIRKEKNKNSLNLTYLEPSMYILSVKTDKKTSFFKIIKN